MKLKYSIFCLFWLVSLAAHAQKARRVFRSGDYLVVADSAGTNPVAYPHSKTSLYVKGSYIFVQTTAGAFAYLPTKLLNASGVSYSIVSPIDAFNAYLLSASQGGKLDVVLSTSTASTTAAQTGSPKLIFETIDGELTIYVYAATASPTLQKLMTYN